MLTRENTVLVVIDVQEKLFPVMHNHESLSANLQTLIQGIRALGVPIIWLEQNPAGLGPTVPEVAQHLAGLEPITKVTFSCCGEPAFADAIEALGRQQALLCGIESHVCVYQTAIDLAQFGHEVEVATDAVSSRSTDTKATALRKLEHAGVGLTCTEMALFELLQAGEGPEFKEILKLVK